MKCLIRMFFFVCCFLQSALAYAQLHAIDGDSLMDGETRIRLDGIDAPEIFQTCRQNDEEYPCGQEAYIYLKNLMQNNNVNCSCLAQKDKYGRSLCECFAGDLSLNRQMVKAGWAMPYRSEKYTSEQNEAMQNHIGLWQGKFMRPALFRALERLRQREYKP